MIVRHPEKVNNPINPIKKKPRWIKTKIFFTTSPDIILHNANIITINSKKPKAQAIAKEGENKAWAKTL